MDESEVLYRMYFNMMINTVTQKALANNFTVQEIVDELEYEMRLLVDNVANNISEEELEKLTRVIQEEATNFTQQFTKEKEYKDVDDIMEEIGWT